MDKKRFVSAEKLSVQDSFRFCCDGCGNCCRDRGDILLNPHDMVRIRKFLGISLNELLDTYCEVYVGEASGLPVVRLRHSAVCVFLMHGKCLIQEAKPSVCVLYPLGRMTEAGKKEIKYFLQDVSCGTKDQENNVADWLRNLGEDHEECAGRWHELIAEAASFMQNVPRMEEMYLRRFHAVLFGLMYDGYDCDKPLAPQLLERLKKLRIFFRELADAAGKGASRPESGGERRTPDGQTDDNM